MLSKRFKTWHYRNDRVIKIFKESRMKILIAPDSFKESLEALDVCHAIQSGFSQVFPDADYKLLPTTTTTVVVVFIVEGA